MRRGVVVVLGRVAAGLLLSRVAAGEVSEIILATSATVEGQTTGHYISDRLEDIGSERGAGPNITRLAHGVPVGGELDYLDEGTISAAIRSRTSF